MGDAAIGDELPKEQYDSDTKSDPLLKELNNIRRRRTDGDKRSMFAKKENPVLLMGIAYGPLRSAHFVNVLRAFGPINFVGSFRLNDDPRYR